MDMSVEESYEVLLHFSEEVIDWSKEQSFEFREETLYLPHLMSIQNFGVIFRFQYESIVRRHLNTSLIHKLRVNLESDIKSWKRVDKIFTDFLLSTSANLLPIEPMSEFTLAQYVLENNYPVEEIVAYFNNRLYRRPHRFACRVMLHGISLGQYDGHNIHPPMDKDLSIGTVKLRPIQEQDILPKPKTELSFGQHYIEDAHSILEWLIIVPPSSLQIDVLQEKILEQVKRLRLVVGGEWTPTKWYLQSIDSPWVSQNRPYHILFNKKYIDKGEMFILDLARKQDFMDMGDIVEERFSDGSYLAKRVSITLEKWEDAIYKEPVDTVCNCVIGLETIFKKKQRERGLTSKIPKRIAAMFESVEHSDADVLKLIEDAYTIRNADLHGEIADEELASRINSDVFETVRKAMLVWLQFRIETESCMKSLISKLDSSPEDVMWSDGRLLI